MLEMKPILDVVNEGAQGGGETVGKNFGFSILDFDCLERTMRRLWTFEPADCLGMGFGIGLGNTVPGYFSQRHLWAFIPRI